MTVPITLMSDAEAGRLAAPSRDAGLGALRTERGNLPLEAIDVRADITGLTGRVELTQDFINTFDVPLEATYVFPLPDRGAVTGMRMTADGRVVAAELQERAAARQAYDHAVAAGRRAAIAEEERPDVFTMRVGNIAPGERVSVALTLVCPLSYEDGEAAFRFPLVVAPRYIPGAALDGAAAGTGYGDDTDAVPDASRITPPVLLPGFPNPVRLSIDVGIDPAGLSLADVRASMHAIRTDDGRLRIQPGERANRDFVLRMRYGSTDFANSLVLVPDDEGEEGTYQLTVLPPVASAPPRPRDVVLVLDRSGSMGGWKMVTARRAAARIVDTLTTADRFAVLTFDDVIDRSDALPEGLVEANDRNRYRAVEHLARVDARGGTALLAPLRNALVLLANSEGRDAVLVLVTDGQVGNEDQILRELADDLPQVRVHAVGIDRAVNAGFLGRLAAAGGGRCELVESEERLDEAMAAIHRRIGAPLAHGLRLDADRLATIDDTVSPARLPDLFPGVPLVVAGRYRGTATGSIVLHAKTGDGRDWSVGVAGRRRDARAVTAQWARAHLRDLEDRYAAAPDWAGGSGELEKRIVSTSLRFGVLCRFTAYVAVDSRVSATGTERHRVTQPVEAPAGWHMSPFASAAFGHAAEAVECAPEPAAFFFDRDTAPASPSPEFGSRPMPNSHRPSRFRVMRASLDGDDSPPAPDSRSAPSEDRTLATARQLARDEARRLRNAGPLTDDERRKLLNDLANLLSALVLHLTTEGAPRSAFSALRELAARLKAGSAVGTMWDEQLWDEALRVLDHFAAGNDSPGKKRRAPFWKRT